MSYYPTSPQANDDPRVSQGELQSNNSKINTDFSINHQPLTTSQNPGFHTKIQFPTGVADPNLSSPQSSLYPKLVSGLAELFFQNDSLATDIVQLTGLPTVTNGTQYALVTPWKLQLNFGSAVASPITFVADAFPAGTTILAAQLTGILGVNPRVTAVNETSLTYSVSSGTSVYYFVLGLLP